ncbi:MAG: hypothetical protein WCD11_21080 [Solirubrobacteraceae bacterium]
MAVLAAAWDCVALAFPPPTAKIATATAAMTIATPAEARYLMFMSVLLLEVRVLP